MPEPIYCGACDRWFATQQDLEDHYAGLTVTTVPAPPRKELRDQ